MPEKGLTYSAGVLIQAEQGRLSAKNIVRRIFQGLGGSACVALAASMPWAEFSSDGIVVGGIRLPLMPLVLIACMVAVGLAFFAASVWGLVKMLPSHTRFGVFAVSLISLFSIAGVEYGVLRTGGVSPYEFRSAAQMVGFALGIALLACTVPEEIGPRVSTMIQKRDFTWRHLAMFSMLAVASGALIGAVVLDGMPHMIDGTSYLLQSRILGSGHLAIDPPMYPVLFADELLHFRTTGAGYFSKYPVGWPALLAVFDTAGVPWLANALLAGLLVLLTYAAAAELASKRLAYIAAAVAAFCPWLWMNAGAMMPHLASGVWLWLFLWMFLRTIRTRSRGFALLSGFALGCAVLTRPSDAAFFALPCIVASLCWCIRVPKVWLTRLPLIGLAALPGTVAYLWINQALTGGDSTYGAGHGEMLFSQAPRSLFHAAAWLHESLVGISTQWFAGAVPLSVLLVCGLVFGRGYLRRHWLLFTCAASLMLCYGVFVFGGRAWVGPRWYVPLIPAFAMLVAAGLLAAAHTGRMRTPAGILAAGYLRSIPVLIVVMLLVVLPARVVALRAQPPHGINDQVVKLVEQQGLSHVVVALPVSGLDPQSGEPNYKRGIAAMWTMQVPFEDSDVIYVAAVDGWEGMAAKAWPGRDLYWMNDNADDMTLNAIGSPKPHSTPLP